ncbi:MAG: 50S ribosomal protein L30e [Acidilobaceae archaeon]
MSTAHIPLDREIKNLVKTGKYYLGSKKSLKAIARGEAKLLIIASNIPSDLKEKALYYAKLSGIPVLTYNGRSVDLGLVAGKPFPVSMIAVLDQGSSRILEVANLSMAQ